MSPAEARPLRLFVIAGEPSGDALGGALLAGMHEVAQRDIQVTGVGGDRMAAQGLVSRFPMRELSVMGVAEILPRLPDLLRRIRETADAVVAERPDALITIDSPDFCLRVAKRARKEIADLRVIHYVAPTVWAWRPGRATKMAKVVDHVLALFPFEPPYMEAAGMSCDFVGHPIASLQVPSAAEVAALRAEMGVREDQRLLAVLPGSRMGEVRRIAPVFAGALERLQAEHSDLAVVVPAAVPVAEAVAAAFPPGAAGWPRMLDPRGVSPAEAEARKRALFAASDVALAASGTVSLELASTGTPMVIGYSASRLTEALVRRLALVDTATMVNLITGTRVVPEYLFEAFTADNLASAVAELLGDQAAQDVQRDAGMRAMEMLGRGGDPPGLRAARSVLDALGRERPSISGSARLQRFSTST